MIAQENDRAVLDAFGSESYQSFMAAFQPKDRNVLRVVLAGGLIRGRDIVRRTGLKPDEVRSSLQALKNENFITLHNGSGNTLDSLDSYVAALPSRRGEADYEASQETKS